jgi:hypothetical protein
MQRKGVLSGARKVVGLLSWPVRADPSGSLQAASFKRRSSTMGGPVWAIVMPLTPNRRPHTEERLPEGNDEPGGDTPAGDRRLHWIPSTVNPCVWTMSLPDAEERRAVEEARQVVSIGIVSRQLPPDGAAVNILRAGRRLAWNLCPHGNPTPSPRKHSPIYVAISLVKLTLAEWIVGRMDPSDKWASFIAGLDSRCRCQASISRSSASRPQRICLQSSSSASADSPPQP